MLCLDKYCCCVVFVLFVPFVRSLRKSFGVLVSGRCLFHFLRVQMFVVRVFLSSFRVHTSAPVQRHTGKDSRTRMLGVWTQFYPQVERTEVKVRPAKKKKTHTFICSRSRHWYSRRRLNLLQSGSKKPTMRRVKMLNDPLQDRSCLTRLASCYSRKTALAASRCLGVSRACHLHLR